jgi:diadenosine tetraphosphate (Ap4A) HIT family hydrolase
MATLFMNPPDGIIFTFVGCKVVGPLISHPTAGTVTARAWTDLQPSRFRHHDLRSLSPMNTTLEKFGYPHTLLQNFEHWCVLMRPAQATLGALVLASKHDATSLGALPFEAHAELHACTSALERALRKFRNFDKINYLALMMVDPHVHFHVLPRYASTQEFDGALFQDAGWPAMPDLKSAPSLSETTHKKLYASLLDAFVELV